MIARVLIVLSCVGLSACVETPPSATALTPSEVAAVRSFNPNDASGVGLTRFSRLANAPRVDAGLDRNCTDFASNLEAQQFFVNNGGPARDPHDLDRDGDGYACEWGTELRQRAAAAERQAATARAAAQRRVAASSRCYTGPRGGTYTITASGARDYDGC